MKRKGKGAWPVVLAMLVIIACGAYFFYTRTVFPDKDYVASNYTCANGVNVIIVSDPYSANNFRDIAKSVKTAIRCGGSNTSVVVVTGEYDVNNGSHIEDLFKALNSTGADEIYAYPTNLDTFSSNYAICLRGQTDTVDLNAKGGSISKGAELRKKAALLSTKRLVDDEAEPFLQIWDIETFERKDVDTSHASVKIIVGGRNVSDIACDVFVFTGDMEGKDAGVMNALSGVGGGKTSFNFETSPTRLFIYCGTSGSKVGDSKLTRHSIGVAEIVNIGE